MIFWTEVSTTGLSHGLEGKLGCFFGIVFSLPDNVSFNYLCEDIGITNNPKYLISFICKVSGCPIFNSSKNLADSNLEPNANRLDILQFPLITYRKLHFRLLDLEDNFPYHLLNILSKLKNTIFNNFLFIFFVAFYYIFV